ncbi:MAG: peptidyl-prolyl cis-trans isomerase, partial [Clostridia bacterium]|nr:peptidyl-prolyl cis-trans isomerase [Clostridia bacterium]
DKKEFIDLLGGKAAFLSYLKDSCLTDREYDKIAENELYFNMLLERVSEENSYTEEELRRFFAENYIGIKYVFLAATDDEGEPLPEERLSEVKARAEEALLKAQDPENEFEDVVNEYGDDPFGGTTVIVSRLEAEGQSYIAGAFELSDYGVGGVFSDGTGFYIVQRVPADVTYYEENRAYIKDTADNMRFASLLDEWSAETRVSVRSSVKRINFNNLKKFVR